jgi:secreted trypsin-like serine protease
MSRSPLLLLSAAVVSLCLVQPPAHGEATIEEAASESFGSPDYLETMRAFLAGELRKIVGGEPAEPGQFPWQVSLGVSWIANPAQAHFCGGSILNETWILTAAHCVDGNTAESIIVTAGTHDLTTGGERRNLKRILVKSDYVQADLGSDIALLELFEPLTLGDNISAIGRTTPDDEAATLNPDGPDLTTSGFGATRQGGRVSSTLNFVDVPFITSEECNAPLSYDGRITEQMICAGDPTGGRDSCQGDSGGPIVGTHEGKAVLVGIVSWGEGCALPLKFGVYSRLAVFAGWVDACLAGQQECDVKE